MVGKGLTPPWADSQLAQQDKVSNSEQLTSSTTDVNYTAAYFPSPWQHGNVIGCSHSYTESSYMCQLQTNNTDITVVFVVLQTF